MRKISEKSLATIEAMKSQSIGVEVEMNNIRREDAARLAAEYFGTGRYEFVGGGCYQRWIAWDASGREWKFERDASIVGPDSEKCEMGTPILYYEDIELLQGLIRVLRKAGAKSDPTRGCGVHIHIGANGHDARSLRNLVNIMASHEDLLVDALHISRSRTCRWCKVVDRVFLQMVNEKKPSSMSELADVWYRSQRADYGRSEHYNESRYHMLNLHATFTKGTIEFRLFQFDAPSGGKQNGLHAGQLKAYIQLCLALSQRAKEVGYASYQEPAARRDNPKYVMRFWLKTLGMIGDEFQTARDLYVSRLEGNSDCRCGDRSNCVSRVA